LGALIAAGIDDWGGVSPVTADHVNPERPWPALDALRTATEADGHVIAPRLTAHREFVLDPERWFDPGLRFAVPDRSDADGLALDDPRSHLPERTRDALHVGSGADVEVENRSGAWYSGASAEAPVLVPSASARSGPVAEVVAGVRLGQEPGFDELLTLFRA